MRLFIWGKRKVSRDEAASLFVNHCKIEAEKIDMAIRTHIIDQCRYYEYRHIVVAIDAPFISFQSGEFTYGPRTVLGAHCYAIALAAGMNAIRAHIDPPNRTNAMIWQVNKLLLEEDAGPENGSHAAGSPVRPREHALYAPGAFAGGLLSQQQKLVSRYRRLGTAADMAALLALAIGLVPSPKGVVLAGYEDADLSNGLIGRDSAGCRETVPYGIGEWTDDLEGNDSELVLSELLVETQSLLITRIQGVDKFWPEFCKKNRLR